MASDSFFRDRGLERGEYYLMTCHRRENVHDRAAFEAILQLVGATDRRVYFPASYRTQAQLKTFGLSVPSNVALVDPIGYREMLVLMVRSRGVITDSGTVVEETCVLQVPSLQLRKATERPQVYDAGSSVKFDPSAPERYPHDVVYRKLEGLFGRTWPHNLGDGQAAGRIVADLTHRMRDCSFRQHRPQDYHLDVGRSYREDGL
jgi:UDP-N-acetylglucosamine 2-epimerase (non-hydrolysing)